MSFPATATTRSVSADRHDGLTIALHWATAVLVLAQFASAHVWEFLPRGTPLRHALISTHVALGIVFALVVLTRIVWRLARPHALPPAGGPLERLAAGTVHLALYALLLAQAVLGFLFGWSAGGGLRFFDLFAVPPLIVLGRENSHLLAEMHNAVAWTLIGVAGLHAAAALLHHHLLRDDVLRRMVYRSE
ncbi:cytochrome b/b6 domain-containing protein [Ancylobacter sp. MQZ15Z-1]|uniref:Cytochrome b/b6 domain-containing protein n=1 Tax=Ancylobacter mangrovi TaxID=2972472 RepID=A0A9X2PLI5_9HYPH|nr:cytochrome b/b6 domain-containing protein [Ancylobacter mangrovi]MCS0497267.1 cytochrome b/b6 domain-containing protein [Ancylobacter mangrovi]